MGLLRDVIDQRDPNDAEYAVFLVNHFKLASECMDELCDLMDADWHREHEELAHIFQWARDPRATDCLSRAALSHLAYRDYDDYGALASQCMYALRTIGTSEAMHAVEKLASADDPMISQYAVWHSARGPLRLP